MAEDVVDLLHRRNDLSTFLVHLTRDSADASALENLVSIVSSKTIEARSVYGMARDWAAVDAAVEATQRCACFSEAPLDQVWMLTRDIEGRGVPMSPYGLVFTKAFGRRMGVNPVWYLDITPAAGRNWLTNPVNVLVEIARRGQSFRIDSPPGKVDGATVPVQAPGEDPILRLTPFLEQMGPTLLAKKEFWWEREWRYVRNFRFGWPRVVAVLAPDEHHEELLERLADSVNEDAEFVESRLRFLDPEWGLERMIAALARVPEEDAGPLPHYP